MQTVKESNLNFFSPTIGVRFTCVRSAPFVNSSVRFEKSEIHAQRFQIAASLTGVSEAERVHAHGLCASDVLRGVVEEHAGFRPEIETAQRQFVDVGIRLVHLLYAGHHRALQQLAELRETFECEMERLMRTNSSTPTRRSLQPSNHEAAVPYPESCGGAASP